MAEVLNLDTPHLGNRSYLVHDGDVAVAIDPPRDVDRVVALAGRAGVRIDLVLDTHGHGDWLTGGPGLSRLTGARYAGPAEIGGAARTVTLSDGDQVSVGDLTVTAVHTPGHTPGHLTYVVHDKGKLVGAFTGGSMLHGAVGRTDLNGADQTAPLAHKQWASVRALASQLPTDTQVLPMHGFGSFCSASSTSADSSTVADQLKVNPALTQDEERFVTELIASLDAYPSFYARMAPANAAGPGLPDLAPPEPVDSAELRRRIEAGEWVVDLRSRTAFAAGHLPGTLNVEAVGNVVTYLGWLLPADAPLTLIGETPEQVAEVQRELALIGVERPAAAIGSLDQLAPGVELTSFGRADFAALAERWQQGKAPYVLDVRRNSEWRDGHIDGAVHIPLHELPDRLAEVPDGEVWVHCAGGFRASIAAALLDRSGRHHVVTIDDEFSPQTLKDLPLADSTPVGAPA